MKNLKKLLSPLVAVAFLLLTVTACGGGSNPATRLPAAELSGNIWRNTVTDGGIQYNNGAPLTVNLRAGGNFVIPTRTNNNAVVSAVGDRTIGTRAIDYDSDDDYLVFGYWTDSTIANGFGSFAVGNFPVSSYQLPAGGSADYQGTAIMYDNGVSRDGTVDFTALFSGTEGTTVSGRLDVADEFSFDLQRATFRRFSGLGGLGFFSGNLACATGDIQGSCEPTADARSFWEGVFSGQVDAALGNALTKFGGRFGLDGFTLNGRNDLSPEVTFGVIGAFGSSLTSYEGADGGGGGATPIATTPPPPARLSGNIGSGTVGNGGVQYNTGKPLTINLTAGGNFVIPTRTDNADKTDTVGDRTVRTMALDYDSDDDYLVFGYWTNTMDSDDSDLFAIGNFPASSYQLPAGGSATYSGTAILDDNGISRDGTINFTALFGGTEGTTVSGRLDVANEFSLDFQEATFQRFPGLGGLGYFGDNIGGNGNIACGTGNGVQGSCEDPGGAASDGSWAGVFSGQVDASNGNALSKFGGAFGWEGFTLNGRNDSPDVGVRGAFGTSLGTYTPAQ